MFSECFAPFLLNSLKSSNEKCFLEIKNIKHFEDSSNDIIEKKIYSKKYQQNPIIQCIPSSSTFITCFCTVKDHRCV